MGIYGFGNAGFGPVIENNLVFDNHGAAVVISGARPGSRVQNNTPEGDGIQASSSRDVTLRNNILWVEAGHGIQVADDNQIDFDSDYNWFYEGGDPDAHVGYWGGDRDLLAEWQAASEKDLNSLAGQPSLSEFFVEVGGANGRLGYDVIAQMDFGSDDNFMPKAHSPVIPIPVPMPAVIPLPIPMPALLPTPIPMPAGSYRLTISGSSTVHDFSGLALDGDGDGTAGGDYVRFFTVEATAMVVGRHVFYNNSTFDDASEGRDDDHAVAPDKAALMPGEPATFANYTSYSRGINGIMIDITNLPGVPTADDFLFRVGNDSDPNGDGWSDFLQTPEVTVRPGDGDFDRVTLIWEENAVRNQWLQVTVLPTDKTGLTTADVFYFGNTIGESGDSASLAKTQQRFGSCRHTMPSWDRLPARNRPAGKPRQSKWTGCTSWSLPIR